MQHKQNIVADVNQQSTMITMMIRLCLHQTNLTATGLPMTRAVRGPQVTGAVVDLTAEARLVHGKQERIEQNENT